MKIYYKYLVCVTVLEDVVCINENILQIWAWHRLVLEVG